MTKATTLTLGSDYLQDSRFSYCELRTDVVSICEYAGIDPADITAALVDVGDGDYNEIWVTEYAAPYRVDAIYHPISYYK